MNKQPNVTAKAQLERTSQPEINPTDLTVLGKKLLTEIESDLIVQGIKKRHSPHHAHFTAIKNWLGKYQPLSGVSRLEQVRGYLEAFYHLCEISDWRNAHRLAFAQTEDSSAEELHEQLFNWSYYREQQHLYESLLYRLDCQVDLVCLNGLASLHDVLCEPLQSLNYCQQSLALARKLGIAAAEATALGNLGNAYLSLGQPKRSLTYYQQHLEKAQVVGNLSSVGIALGNLSNVYRILEDYDRAIDYIEQRLEIAHTVRDRRGEGYAYSNLGGVYALQGRLAEAVALQQKAIAIAQEMGNRLGECRAYGNLGLVYQALGDDAEAIECFQSTLHIAREIEDREAERMAILQLGDLCQQTDRYKDAIYYQQIALGFVTDPVRIGSLMLNLGTANRELGKRLEAIAWYEKLIETASRVSEDFPERHNFLTMSHYCLAFTYWQMGRWIKAITACDQALTLTDTFMAPLAEKIEELRHQVLSDIKSASTEH